MAGSPASPSLLPCHNRRSEPSRSRWVSQEDLQAHLLAGRAGWGERRRVRQLLPLNFREVLACTHPELTLPPRVHPARLQEPAVAAALEALAFSVDADDLPWQGYLRSGGFARAVAEHHRTGAVGASASTSARKQASLSR